MENLVLNKRQKLFVERYCVHLNASLAAREAGYSENTCAETGYENLRKPHIAAAVDQLLKDKQLGPQQVKKAISDIAKTSLNEFFTIKQVEYTPRLQLKLGVYIANLKDKLDFEQEYAQRAGLSEEERKQHEAWRTEQEKQIIRLELELERNPRAVRFVDGPTELIETAELDLVKIVRAKESGRIKSYTLTKEGPRIEMYAADAALRDLARVHGLFIDKVQHSGKDGGPLEIQWREAV
jgi:phage terminase small subunit